ncbi:MULTISPECIES: hypothetical protein, partial [unclassified Paraburkholderia]|uniref:hypothetical protein n=1 Tax=unclassified Paraburkholderia TaxID=2615204 RepID=UPI001C846D04
RVLPHSNACSSSSSQHPTSFKVLHLELETKVIRAGFQSTRNGYQSLVGCAPHIPHETIAIESSANTTPFILVLDSRQDLIADDLRGTVECLIMADLSLMR